MLWIIGIFVGLVMISAITHNVLKSIEKNKYEIGQSININGKNMQAYVKGSGEKTIVLLSGLGTASPITDFMPLAERLSPNYKVVILEYFGYGFSDTTREVRSNKNIVNEIRLALKELNVQGPYILMPHSISGVYAMYDAINFPKEVEAIIGIDASMPNQTKTNKDPNMSPYLTLLNTFGIVRDVTYLFPGADDGMNKNNYYSTDQLKLKKMATAWNSLNETVINEFNMVNENTKELYDVKYPNDLPVLNFVSNASIDENKEWLPLHEEVISNPSIQKVVTLSGEHYLHWTNADEIAKMVKEFTSTHFKE